MKGREIIKVVCREAEIPAKLLLNSDVRDREVSQARRRTITMMRAEGMSITQISRILGIHTAAVKYHIYPKRRENVRRYMRAYLLRQQAVSA